jgi:hypothetical protein
MRILRGLNSHELDCGCLLGVYETYDGLVVRLIDAVSDRCTNPGHRPGNIVASEGGGVARSQDATPPATRTASKS